MKTINQPILDQLPFITCTEDNCSNFHYWELQYDGLNIGIITCGFNETRFFVEHYDSQSFADFSSLQEACDWLITRHQNYLVLLVKQRLIT